MIILFFLIDEADHWLFHQIHFQWRNPWLDAAIPFFSDPFTHYKLALLIAAGLLIVFSGRRMRLTIIFVLLTVLISDILSSRIFKNLYGIARPMSEISKDVSGFSFPSSHAVNTWAAISLFQQENPRFRIVLWIIGSLVCFSRIYVGDHYPGDVLAGVVLGMVIGRNAYKLQLAAETAWGRIITQCRSWITRYQAKSK
jgi:undecaprenyl-diphosphatase